METHSHSDLFSSSFCRLTKKQTANNKKHLRSAAAVTMRHAIKQHNTSELKPERPEGFCWKDEKPLGLVTDLRS